MQSDKKAAPGRTGLILTAVILCAVLAAAAILSVHLAKDRQRYRLRSASLIAQAESAEAQWREIDEDKTGVWYPRRDAVREEVSELNAQIADNNRNAERPRAQVEAIQGYLTQAQQAGLSARLLNSAAAYLERRAETGASVEAAP